MVSYKKKTHRGKKHIVRKRRTARSRKGGMPGPQPPLAQVSSGKALDVLGNKNMNDMERGYSKSLPPVYPPLLSRQMSVSGSSIIQQPVHKSLRGPDMLGGKRRRGTRRRSSASRARNCRKNGKSQKKKSMMARLFGL